MLPIGAFHGSAAAGERLARLGVLGLLLALPGVAAGRAQAPDASLPQAATLVEPAVGELRSALAGLRISKWKAPSPVKDEADQNVASIVRDLDATLPALVAQADLPPRGAANAFAVYRNLDALYEVVLRVSGTADLAASESEAASLTHALTTLDVARRSLADSILSVSRAQEAELAQRQVPAAGPAQAPAPATNVVSDGPASPASTGHRKSRSKPKVASPPS